MTILGAGAWGTALALQAARAGGRVVLWGRDPRHVAALRSARENARYLPGIELPGGIVATANISEAAAADLVIVALPMQHLRSVLTGLPPIAAPLLFCAKGIELATLRLPLEVAGELRPGVATGVLSGPNFATEIAAGRPAASVCASNDAGVWDLVAATFGGLPFRVYRSRDAVGVQVCGAAKNVIAIAAGITIGAGLGENARAAIVARGMHETAKLAVQLGGTLETVFGLAGSGDFFLSCATNGSRNYRVGLALGQGGSLADFAKTNSGVTEGVDTAPALVARAAASGVDMPIADAVRAVLSDEITVTEAIDQLLSRPLPKEF